MSCLIIHVGSAKAGSTAIQDACFLNSDKLFKQGFYYPTEHCLDRRHLPLARFVGQLPAKDASSSIAQTLENYITKANNRAVLLSSEEFGGLDKEKINYFYEILCQHFDKIKIICYVRHPCDYLESVYKQKVKQEGIKETINEFLSTYIAGLNYLYFIEKWKHYHLAEVSVFPYVKSSFAQGDIVTDFFSKINVDSREFQTCRDRNQSQTSLASTIVISLRRIFPSKTHDHLYSREFVLELDRKIRDSTNHDINLLTLEQYTRILESQRADIQILNEQYGLENVEGLTENRWSDTGLSSSEAIDLAVRVAMEALKKR